MTVLAYKALSSFLKQRQQNMFLSKSSEVKGEEEAMLYLGCLEELAKKVENEESDIILISLKTQHEM